MNGIMSPNCTRIIRLNEHNGPDVSRPENTAGDQFNFFTAILEKVLGKQETGGIS